jgi:tetratricopeptide (TPR) repeat protein
MIFRSIVQLMAALYVLLIWRDKSYLPKSNPVTWAFISFTLMFTIASIFSVAQAQSVWGTLERMGGLFTFWHYLIFYIITVSVLRTRQDWQTLLDIIISVGVVSALYGYLQRFNITAILGSGNRQRIFGTIGNPALFAGYQILVAYLALTLAFIKRTATSKSNALLIVGIGLGSALLLGILSNSLVWLMGLWIVPMGYAMYGFFLWIAKSEKGARWFYILTAGTAFLAVMMTAVRGSLLAIVVASLLFALLWSTLYRSHRAKKALLGGIAALAVFVVLAIALRNTSFVQNSPYLKRVTDFSAQTTTVQTRFWAWSAGFKGWSDTPKTILVGWGPENFNVPFSKYFNPKFFTGPGAETFFDRAHNMFVEVLVTIGVFGLLAYLSIFVALFWILVRMMRKSGDYRVIGIGFTALTVAYIIHNAFIFDTSANFITFFMLLAFAAHVSMRGLDVIETSTQRTIQLTGFQKITAVALGFVVVITVYATNMRPVLANFATTRAIVAGWSGDWATAISKYQQSIGYDTQGHYEYRHRFAQYILEVASSMDTTKIPNFNDVVLQVISEVQKNTIENPRDYLPYLYISRLYIALGKADPASKYNDLALQYSKKALDISPTFVRTYYEVAQAYLNKKDNAQALEWFAKAAKLNPDVGITYWYMGVIRYQIADKAGDIAGKKEALQYLETALKKNYTPSESDIQKIVAVYLELGNIQGVVPVIEKLVKLVPDNAQYWASLATAYVRVGRTKDAIAAARKVLELSSKDPETKAQAEQFIRDLGGTP